MSTTIKASPIVQTENILGEGPLWHSIHQMLYWVDIQSKIVHGYEPHTGLHREWPVPKKVGTIVPASNGHLILGLQGEIAELDPVSGNVSTLVRLESDRPQNRCNDGKCDPAGRLWVGTMNVDAKPEAGSLYCIDKELSVNKVLTGLTIANGMGWSPDGKYMYFIDSAEYHVKRFIFTSEKNWLKDESVVLRFNKENGQPDGLCVDADGMLWIGFYGGSRVGRYDPATGKHLLDVSVPAPNVTSCAFGGKDLHTLYITTAREGLDHEKIKQFPSSGNLFACEPNVAGTDAGIFETGAPD